MQIFLFLQEIRPRWKQATQNTESSKNFQQYLIYDTWLHRSLNKVLFWRLDNALTGEILYSQLPSCKQSILLSTCYMTKVIFAHGHNFAKPIWLTRLPFPTPAKPCFKLVFITNVHYVIHHEHSNCLLKNCSNQTLLQFSQGVARNLCSQLWPSGMQTFIILYFELWVFWFIILII